MAARLEHERGSAQLHGKIASLEEGIYSLFTFACLINGIATLILAGSAAGLLMIVSAALHYSALQKTRKLAQLMQIDPRIRLLMENNGRLARENEELALQVLLMNHCNAILRARYQAFSIAQRRLDNVQANSNSRFY